MSAKTGNGTKNKRGKKKDTKSPFFLSHEDKIKRERKGKIEN